MLYKYNNLVCLFFFIQIDPSGAPAHAVFELIEDRSLNISIGVVDPHQENGIILFYNISYTSMDWQDHIHNQLSINITHLESDIEQWNAFNDGFVNCSVNTPEIPLSSSTQILLTRIEGLKPNTNYMFNITACNQFACALPSNVTTTTITNKTLPGAPDCFPNVTSVQNTSSTSILANWTHLTHHCKNGDFVQYHVALFDNDDYPHWVVNQSLITLDDIKNQMFNYTTIDDWYEFDNLKKYWKYSFMLFYQNVVGLGPISDLISISTEEDGMATFIRQFRILINLLKEFIKF